MKPRVVLDTNNLISGIFFEKGNEARVLEDALAGRAKLLASLETLQEFQETVSRPKFQLSLSDVLTIFQLVVSRCEIILAPPRAKVKCRDPDDQKFLDCAIAGKADFLVTGDRDLLIMGKVSRTKIVTAAKLTRILTDPLFRLKPVKFREKIHSSEIDRFLYHTR